MINWTIVSRTKLTVFATIGVQRATLAILSQHSTMRERRHVARVHLRQLMTCPIRRRWKLEAELVRGRASAVCGSVACGGRAIDRPTDAAVNLSVLDDKPRCSPVPPPVTTSARSPPNVSARRGHVYSQSAENTAGGVTKGGGHLPRSQQARGTEQPHENILWLTQKRV